MEASVSVRAGTGLKKVLLVDDCQTSLLVHHTMDEAARSGGTDYLTKPVDGTKLRSKVSEQLGA